MSDQAARVLVVDSEPKVLATVSMLLRQEGHRVETAARLESVLREPAGEGPTSSSPSSARERWIC